MTLNDFAETILYNLTEEVMKEENNGRTITKKTGNYIMNKDTFKFIKRVAEKNTNNS